MAFRTKLFGITYDFKDVKEVLAKANEQKSGDEAAGVAAKSVAERIAAKTVLAEIPMWVLRAQPVVAYEDDEITRAIDDGLDLVAYEKIKNLNPRIGLCIDIGHTLRYGVDPSRAAKQYADRLLDVHIKDVTAAAAAGKTVEIGRGVIDIPKFLRTLIEIRYAGVVSFEFEKDPKDPLAGLAESVGYVRGVLAVI